nr:MAG TPA: hypothetical protein [Caudoviricetes sp.]
MDNPQRRLLLDKRSAQRLGKARGNPKIRWLKYHTKRVGPIVDEM